MDIIIVYDNIKDRKFFDLHEFKIPFNLEYINDKRTSYKIKTHWGAIKSPFVEIKDDNGKTVLNKFGNPVVINRKPPTVTGLALALGFTSRLDLLRYQGKEEFCNTITRAKSMVEQYAEERLFDRDGSNGAQFSLRNNFKGWDADKKNDNSGDGKITIVNNIPRPEKQDE